MLRLKFKLKLSNLNFINKTSDHMQKKFLKASSR